MRRTLLLLLTLSGLAAFIFTGCGDSKSPSHKPSAKSPAAVKAKQQEKARKYFFLVRRQYHTAMIRLPQSYDKNDYDSYYRESQALLAPAPWVLHTACQGDWTSAETLSLRQYQSQAGNSNWLLLHCVHDFGAAHGSVYLNPKGQVTDL